MRDTTVNCCIIHSERAGAARQGMRDSPAEDEARTTEERQELRTTNDLLIEILTPRRRRRSRARAGQTELNLNYSAEYSSLGTPEMTARDGRKTHFRQEFNAHHVRHEILTSLPR